jgi:hypothetical protein
MAKGIWIYVQIILTLIAVITGLGVMQFAVNSHNTLNLVAGLLTLLGLPPLVAFLCKRISEQLTEGK